MTNIYEQHDKAFKNVSAYAILLNGERVANISIKFPADGAGRLYAYVHWIGVEMVRGLANGYGYDKQSAAIEHAALKLEDNEETHAFKLALHNLGGIHWTRALEDAGFTVLQVI